jgi:hypothetical protein
MKYYTKTYIDWIDGRYQVVAEHSRIYLGPVELSKGASAQENDIAKSNQELNKTLIGAYNTAFANQAAVFNAVKAVYDPILKAGPGQYGFTTAEDAAFRTQASEGTAGLYKQASGAAAERMAAAGGGNTFLPSGVQADIQGKIAGAAAESESSKQLGITEAGYEQGRQNFQNATNVEMGVAAGYNPLGYAGAATSSGGSAFNMAKTIQEENAAASPWGAIGGMIGGAAGAFLGNPAAVAGMFGAAGKAARGSEWGGSANLPPSPDESGWTWDR